MDSLAARGVVIENEDEPAGRGDALADLNAGMGAPSHRRLTAEQLIHQHRSLVALACCDHLVTRDPSPEPAWPGPRRRPPSTSCAALSAMRAAM